MSDLMKSVALAALLAVSGPALAQETSPDQDAAPAGQTDEGAPTGDDAAGADAATDGSETQSPSEGLAMGEEVGGGEPVGRSYTKATFDDWEQRCIRTEDGADPCQLYQLLRDEGGNAVAEMSIFALPEGQQAAAGSTIITPLETLLTGQLTLSIDGGAAKRYPFDFCAEQGCFARIGFTDDEIQDFRGGNAGELVIVPAAAPDQQIELQISLKGFTAGYDAVQKDNAE